jgi:hypothetical protein
LTFFLTENHAQARPKLFALYTTLFAQYTTIKV